ncbi:YebC/PmpR family DNA-binding transcriptional regulator [TM7 phylum sp. oral taxon 350]|nr:YebC/PmpR family DNA-binding transcriptional regulator [TM7 phylum sp. oral taxon 350]
MSGHSKWSTIKRQKGANDAKRGAVFTKIGNQIAIAARNGTDPDMNPSLAMVIEKAKQANMPNSNIQRAIDRVKDKNAATLEEIVYEGYAPGGVALIIETATDNKNRTFPEVRHALTKNGGTVADSGSVMFQFDRKGVITVKATGDDALLAILDAGATDANEEDEMIEAVTDAKDLMKVKKAIEDQGLTVEEAELRYVAKNDVPVTDKETADKIIRIMDALDDLDDVLNVHSNADFQVDLGE